MNAVLERAMAHFSAQERQQIAVPEWGEEGKALIVWYTPLTVMEKRRIFKSGMRAADDQALSVDAIIEKALDADGKKLFTIDDREALLRKVAAKVIERVALALLGGKLPAGDDVDGDIDGDVAKN